MNTTMTYKYTENRYTVIACSQSFGAPGGVWRHFPTSSATTGQDTYFRTGTLWSLSGRHWQNASQIEQKIRAESVPRDFGTSFDTWQVWWVQHMTCGSSHWVTQRWMG